MAEIFVYGLSLPEGPVLLTDGSWVCVEMGPDRGCVTQISPDGSEKRIIARTGRPNGLARDKDGYIWVAESEKPSLLKMGLDGRSEIFLTAYDEEEFLFPNDLAFGPDGWLYMTDSGILFENVVTDSGIRPDFLELYPDGRVYRINTKTGDVEKIDTGIRFTNGIAFGPDKWLYVNESLTGNVYRYPWRDGRIVGERHLFGNIINPDAPGWLKSVDGMKFGADGRLYATVYGQKDVTVLNLDGALADRIETDGLNPSNLAFGPAGTKSIFVTECEQGTIEIHPVGCDGLPLYY